MTITHVTVDGRDAVMSDMFGGYVKLVFKDGEVRIAQTTDTITTPKSTISGLASILKGAPIGNNNAAKDHKNKPKKPKIRASATMRGKDVVAKLEKFGWTLGKITGSHHHMIKEGFRPVPVPVHSKETIGTPLLRMISRQTGVTL